MSEPESKFMCPCLGPLEENLKKAKGESAYLDLCQFADLSGKEVVRYRGQHPMKFRQEIKEEVKPGKFRKKWVTCHFNAKFCCMCGQPIK